MTHVPVAEALDALACMLLLRSRYSRDIQSSGAPRCAGTGEVLQ